MVFRKALLLSGLFGLLVSWNSASAAEAPLSRYAKVAVDTVKTSIYIGSVTLTAPPFVREGGTYTATYSAKVFPYFFFNEKGTLWIDITDANLRAIERGESVEFTGHAKNQDGDERHIEGKATPTDALSGKLKVRIFVSKKTELIFNTTYRFPAP